VWSVQYPTLEPECLHQGPKKAFPCSKKIYIILGKCFTIYGILFLFYLTIIPSVFLSFPITHESLRIIIFSFKKIMDIRVSSYVKQLTYLLVSKSLINSITKEVPSLATVILTPISTRSPLNN
jgi:hypothetical protein